MVTERRRGTATPPPLPRYAVIMAGGRGARFWPRSRRAQPKHLLAIRGKRTLLQATAARLRPLVSWRRMLVVTTAAHAAEVRRQLPRVPAEQVLVEPEGRNTLACIVLATAWLRTRVADASLVVVPADHMIEDEPALRRSLERALALAERHDCLVTLGIVPTRPDTGFGYIEAADAVDRRHPAAHWVRRFHEKPSAARARRYLVAGTHLWNSGMFVWKASVFEAAGHRYAPGVLSALGDLWRSPRGVQQRLRRAYRRLPAVSVDAGVLQPLSRQASPPARIAVVRAACGWSDLGSWTAMPAVFGRDARGNTNTGKLVAIDAGDCIVYAPERLVALVGVRDLIVVDSPDALLICARGRDQDVRRVTDELQRRGWRRYR